LSPLTVADLVEVSPVLSRFRLALFLCGSIPKDFYVAAYFLRAVCQSTMIELISSIAKPSTVAVVVIVAILVRSSDTYIATRTVSLIRSRHEMPTCYGFTRCPSILDPD